MDKLIWNVETWRRTTAADLKSIVVFSAYLTLITTEDFFKIHKNYFWEADEIWQENGRCNIRYYLEALTEEKLAKKIEDMKNKIEMKIQQNKEA